jgi:hypothetical protein
METIDFNVRISVKKQDIQDLLVCAFEGGSNYWYDQLEPLKETIKTGHASDQFYGNMMKHGFKLMDKEGENESTYKVTPDQFAAALKLMHDKYPSHFNDVKTENTDASTGDIFLQLLVFGDVIYG